MGPGVMPGLTRHLFERLAIDRGETRFQVSKSEYRPLVKPDKDPGSGAGVTSNRLGSRVMVGVTGYGPEWRVMDRGDGPWRHAGLDPASIRTSGYRSG